VTGDRLARLRAAADQPDLTGTRYALGEKLGRGGMGTVYRARDAALDRDVAVKVLSAPDPDGALGARLSREARILGRLDHPSVVPVHDVGALPDGRPYYVMKLVAGERLDAWAAKTRGEDGAAPDARAVARALVRVAEAVAFAHARGVVHRDLKPANVMVGAFGEVYVLDWGVAKVVGNPEPAGESARAGEPSAADVAPTADGAAVGTPGFMAPEQARGDVGATDARSDVYALGATLHMLVPRPPRALAAIAARAAAEDPAARYPSALAFAADLGRWLDGRRPESHAESPAERVGRLLRTHRVIVGLLTAYLVMRVALVVLGRL
jgi:serine/threonine protein kinase